MASMKKYVLYGVTLAALCSVTVTHPSSALFGLARSETAEIQQSVKENAVEVLDARRDEQFQKQQEVKDRIAERRAAVAEKLAGKRAETCEQKEHNINQMLTSKVDTAQSYYDRFQSIQTKLTEFARYHELDVDNAQALELILSEKQQNAAVFIETARATGFSCEETAADNPGQIVRELVDQKKQALVEYRDALKEYAAAVKEAAAEHEATPHRHGSATTGDER